MTIIIGLFKCKREERTGLKKNTDRDNVSTKIWGITSIAFLHTRVVEKDTLEDFCSKFIFTLSNVINKTYASEDTKCRE